jgi:pyruvate/2-oxoglutarate/acetoin dehydrogenase E1 component/TPP-dependent pyruvate/acetoin dehydrogenase alpha subunit
MSHTVQEVRNSLASLPADEVLSDYRLAWESREASMLGRKEVFMGKAKFGIFGDGKETAQIAMAKVFRPGDFRSGYYRDQTFMMAIGELTTRQYFAQLYAHPDVEADPASAGRLMNGHFATRMLDENGELRPLARLKNSSADISPTAAQMPRLLGLAYASKLFRNNPDLHHLRDLSENGNEIAFGTIGNASTSEGHFFETINAAAVLQVPMLVAVWDDGYGISVPQEYHTAKESISKALAGFQRTETEKGVEIFTVRGWDYEGLISTFQRAEQVCRTGHVPVLVHVTEMTQPQGHSTSGSHERYKPKERLEWEKDFDCLLKMRQWILERELATVSELDELELEGKQAARTAKETAWSTFMAEIMNEQATLIPLLERASAQMPQVSTIREDLEHTHHPLRMDAVKAARKAVRFLRYSDSEVKHALLEWISKSGQQNDDRFSSHLYSSTKWSSLRITPVAVRYDENAPLVDGREILQACFRHALERDPKIFAFGEDVGRIGDVNQGFAGLQAIYGELRVTDTGIRETTIVGQGIGAALRGLRPIAEIQYLDYLIYALQTLSDDLACLHYRTKGGQKAPLIVRTRGHRLEGVWHAGSQMGMMLTTLRGMYLVVPRNMTQAAGFYNTLLESDDAAVVVECLNGYRLKEKMPANIAEFKLPLGLPEILRAGNDVTVVTYGAMCRVVLEAADELESIGISAEVIDVQTLLPFDLTGIISESVKKTGRVVFADEDVPGGASAFLMQQVLEKQGAYRFLDSAPVTITGKEHRPAYGSDGDYFSKPSSEDVFERVYQLMHDSEPEKFPHLFGKPNT